MPVITVLEAIRDAMREEMRKDERVFVMGEDIGARGGVFLATDGFLSEFGEERVIDTPLAESSIAGIALGSAMSGLRPIAEIEFADFIWPTINQIVGEASKVRYGTEGKLQAPMVLRAPQGGGVRGALYHSQSVEALFAHTPGLKVVTPSTPYDAKGLLKASIRDDDPVFVVNDKKLINMTGFVPDEDYRIELGKGRYLRKGSDVTLVGMSYTSVVCKEAAEKLEKLDIDAEVIDLMSLSPLDEQIIIESVSKTNRIVIVDEDNPRASMASEIAAIVSDKAFDYLDAPVKRVTAPHTPVPYSKGLEDEFMPDSDDVVQTVKNILDI